jgi:Ku70/Ku80-like protein
MSCGRSRSKRPVSSRSSLKTSTGWTRQAYYLAPQEGGEKAYGLLVEALHGTSRVGIAKVVIRNKQHLACLRPYKNLLVLDTMYYHDEVRSPDEVAGDAHPAGEPRKAEIEMAKSLVENLSADFEPDRYDDTYRSELLDLIRSKAQGTPLPKPQDEEAPVVDLMQALRESVEQTQRRRQGSKRAKSASQRPLGNEQPGGGAQVVGKRLLSLGPLSRVLDPHDCGRVHGGHDVWSETGVCERRPAVDCDPERRAEKRLRGRGAEKDQDAGSDRGEFRVEPGTAGSDLTAVGFVVDPSPAACAPLEVLDGICDVHRVPVDAGSREGDVQYVAGRPDERPTRTILTIAGLFADKHQLGLARPFAEHGLRGIPPEVARATAGRLARDFREIGA